MFGTLGGQEILFILVLALIVFGPKKLPEIGKSIGRMMNEFRKASNDFRRTLEEEVEADKARPIEPASPPSEEYTAPSPEVPPADSHGSTETAAPGEVEPPAVAPPEQPTVSRPEPAGVGRPDGRPAD
jgi:sec-independent protein translocase protein TatB